MLITRDKITKNSYKHPNDLGKPYYGKPVLLDLYEDGVFTYYVNKFYDQEDYYSVGYKFSFNGQEYGNYFTVQAKPNEDDIKNHIIVLGINASETLKELEKNAK